MRMRLFTLLVLLGCVPAQVVTRDVQRELEPCEQAPCLCPPPAQVDQPRAVRHRPARPPRLMGSSEECPGVFAACLSAVDAMQTAQYIAELEAWARRCEAK